MITTLLIANRGEIALRVIRTCQTMGIRSVAVFTDADVAAPHVAAADDAVRVESYLDIDAVVAAARDSGADAIHPGYGFLSERAAFATAVAAAGITLVGPSAEVMDRMGLKDAAREIAIAAGVPVVPSFDLAGFEIAGARSSTTEGGVYPVLVKAAAGGGGKGMRVVRSAQEYAEALASARREALSSFGDDTMLIETYVEHGRHIEVQVLADAHGNVVHLFERDCSTQRRHQKVLEEAPAPTITPEVRRVVTESAVALAREVGYQNAGTVEFLLDTAPSATGEPRVYFLEMNTRLQVEHPVTEEVVRVLGDRLDLVELQLRVAAGEELWFTQDDVTLRGHAIEARVYAEDSYGGFLPQAGTATLVRWPQAARVDHALESGQVVGTSYDPMLGKVIASGADRESARLALVQALDDTAILGLTTNAGFLRALVASEEFRDATIDTAWLDGVDIATAVPASDAELARLMVAWVSARITAADPPEGGHAFRADGFRLGAAPAPTVVELDRPVTVDRATGTVDDMPVRQLSARDHVLDLIVDARRVTGVVNVQHKHPRVLEVALQGQRHVFTPPDRLAGAVDVGDGTITAPMPGTLLDVRVTEGQQVAEGEVLAMMEAMKMELRLAAPFAGTVTSVGAVTGAQVPLGAALFVVEPETGSAAPDGRDPS